MPLLLQIFNDVHFAIENSQAKNCTRVIRDNPDDGSTAYDNLKVYRFGDRGKEYDWTSPKRHNNNGGTFQRPQNLNVLALSQVRFGRKGAEGLVTPFVSVATNFQALHDEGEVWVQNLLLKVVPDLGVFVVPFVTVMRPGINSHATKVETEWVFYDGDAALLDYLQEWRPNPYRV